MMQNMAEIVKVLFQRVSIERLLTTEYDKKIYYDAIPVDYLSDLRLTYVTQLSDTEVRLQIQEIREEREFAKGYEVKNDELNVFDMLFAYLPEVLTFYDNRCVCKYHMLLPWNQLTKIMGEDLPIAAMKAKKEHDSGREDMNFSWMLVTGHNNMQLNRMLQRGLSDNHCHLRGASPYFAISWINLMNYPQYAGFIVPFEKIESNCRDKKKKADRYLLARPLRNRVLGASLIRLYLFSKLIDIPIDLGMDWEMSEQLQNGKEKLQMNAWRTVEGILDEGYKIEYILPQIQSEINVFGGVGEFKDYIQNYMKSVYYKGEEEYQFFVGERWFLYHMLKHIYARSKYFSRDEYNLFFAYLRIKSELYSELVQVNDIVGFENFQIYQGRKDYFSHMRKWKEDEQQLARLAVKTVLDSPSMKHLEVRISPEQSAEENAYTIQAYDNAIIRAYNDDEYFDDMLAQLFCDGNKQTIGSVLDRGNLKRRFHYVFHFPKMREEVEKNYQGNLECRHYTYREQIRKKAWGILKLREEYPEFGCRVIGIDACAQEIGCRPEVFARVFRTLKKHTVSSSLTNLDYNLPQLKITYHVGEEFLDVVDGLRAIDEAIRFLRLDCGDRIGHGVALGIEPKLWYRAKQCKITLSRQDFLDNVVWLHHALIKHDVKDMEALKGWLEEKYSQYFAYIYQPYINSYWTRKVFEKKGALRTLQYRDDMDITTYYLSWLLRGDTPAAYKSGYFEEPLDKINQWSRNAINRENIRRDDIRDNHEVCLLYYMYHYDVDVRRRGGETKSVDIPPQYIEGVIAVQKAMREEIVQRGIAIETNPTSNLFISIMNNYNEHPLKVFYNNGLTYNEEALMECPQMNVSINTDDSGVFTTRIENEYALLACSMEQELTEEGKPKYKKEFVYRWLDNIREMGLRQVFVDVDLD